MNFATAGFLLFLPLVFALHWALPSQRGRKLVLLGASYYFYAAWDWRFLGLIVLSTAIDFVAGLVMRDDVPERRRRAAVTTSLVANLGILGVFKYAGFFAESLAELAAAVGFPLGRVELEIVLPVGISFFTFQSMSYTIDRYRRRIPVCGDPLDFALFVAFFPQLVAGPIVRAADFLPQLRAPRRLTRGDLVEGLEQILRGLAKKVVVADTLAVVVDAVFAVPGDHGLVGTWVGALAFAGQIYCDFSGYSDVAIGCGRILGYRLPENFRYPYLAASPQEFWRRWHVSLSTWLRDYLYISLGGNRGGASRTHRNLLLTMVLGGLWHGAAWTYVVWGSWHGALLSGHRAWSGRGRAVGAAAGWLATFLAVLAGWVIFRAESMGDVATFYTGMWGARGLGDLALVPWASFLVLAIPAATHLHAALEERGTVSLRAHPTWRAAVATGCLCGIAAFWRAEPTAFIYFQF